MMDVLARAENIIVGGAKTDLAMSWECTYGYLKNINLDSHRLILKFDGIDVDGFIPNIYVCLKKTGMHYGTLSFYGGVKKGSPEYCGNTQLLVVDEVSWGKSLPVISFGHKLELTLMAERGAKSYADFSMESVILYSITKR